MIASVSACAERLGAVPTPLTAVAMSIADADAKAAMPAGDTAPDVGTMLKANMSQPIRKGVAKWTDTVRKEGACRYSLAQPVVVTVLTA